MALWKGSRYRKFRRLRVYFKYFVDSFTGMGTCRIPLGNRFDPLHYGGRNSVRIAALQAFDAWFGAFRCQNTSGEDILELIHSSPVIIWLNDFSEVAAK